MKLRVMARGWHEEDGSWDREVFSGTPEECEKFIGTHYAWEYIDASYSLRYFTIEVVD